MSRIVANKECQSACENSAVARIAQQDLSSDAMQLIRENSANDDAIFFLGRLVWQGEMRDCLPQLSEIAIDHSRGIYARIASVRAVMTCGTTEQQIRLWTQLNKLPQPLPRKLLAEIVQEVTANEVSVGYLMKSIGKLERYSSDKITGFGEALHEFIDRLPTSCTSNGIKPLISMVQGLYGFVSQEPYIEARDCNLSRQFHWLLGHATHAVERLVSTKLKEAIIPEALSILGLGPQVIYWQGENFEDYDTQLYKLVPAWPELNDILFWHCVEDARGNTNANPICDVWAVKWIRQYWSFETSRFQDVLQFVSSRDFLDDKMVALSLAHRLYKEAGEPEHWVGLLITAVEGNRELQTKLDAHLNPVKSAQLIELEAREKERNIRRKALEEEKASKRLKWIERLRANPAIVCSTSETTKNGLSDDLLRLLREVKGDVFQIHRSKGSDWRTLIPEFGEVVAMAFKEAAMSYWRLYSPSLRSDGDDTSTIGYELIFAMTGLEFEANDIDNFPEKLTEAEVRHALRYLVWERNGFPSWFEEMYKIHPNLVLEAVLTELHWELSRTDTTISMHYILSDLVCYAPAIHSHLVPSILSWMERTEFYGIEVLGYGISILVSGNATNAQILKLVRSKVSRSVKCDQNSVWFGLWVNYDAESGIAAVEKWLLSLPPKDASTEAQRFLSELMGTRRSCRIGYSRQSFREVKHLKKLYVLMHKYIRACDDIVRAGKGVYSPNLRDDAQEARSGLFNLLSEIPGKESYVALSELAKEHPDDGYRPWMQRRAYQHAEQDADIEFWTEQQVADFGKHRERIPATNRQLFEITVNRLVDLKEWIESGNHSPYKTWQKADNETEVRNLIAGWLESRACGRYCIAQENELPNAQRPDIWVQSSRIAPVPIELKILDKKWSGPDLCERLRNQLVGDYLREEAAGFGIFLLVWQGKVSSIG